MDIKSMTAGELFDLYRKGKEYKDSLGEKGIFEQTKINERFYAGDQWYGANVGKSRPLARYNVIKRIGEYKISAIGSAPLAVNYTAQGIAYDKREDTALATQMDKLADDRSGMPVDEEAQIAHVMRCLSNYHAVTAERVKLNGCLSEVLLDAFISGTGILYTYWDETVETGQFVDEDKQIPIRGDIACQVLAVENVIFGDPNRDDVQSQPYIILSQRRPVAEVKREAKAYKGKAEDIQADKADDLGVSGGDRGEEPEDTKKVTVLTVLYKSHEADGTCRIMATKVTKGAVVRPVWDVRIRRYPIAKYSWIVRRSCIYGDSEVTYLIPNQIAINKALTAAGWATMLHGMPKMLVNKDVVEGEINNDPGQIINVYAGEGDLAGAIQYVNTPAFAPQFQNMVENMVQSTLQNAGATDAALGQVRPDNAAAIIAQREAAMQPMQLYQNRYFDFCEEVARIFVDFWVNMYDRRRLRVEDKDGVRYAPFEAVKYRTLPITAKVDVGAAAMWSELMAVETLGNLLTAGHITFDQYLERVPKGAVPDAEGLLQEIRTQQQAAQQQAMLQQGAMGAEQQPGMLELFARQYPDLYQQYSQLPPELQQQMMAEMGGEV